MGPDPGEDVLDVVVGIDAVEFCAFDQAVRHGRPAATFLASNEHEVFPSDRDSADGPFDGIVVDGRRAVLGISPEGIPLAQRIADRLPDGARRQDLKRLPIQPFRMGTRTTPP